MNPTPLEPAPEPHAAMLHAAIAAVFDRHVIERYHGPMTTKDEDDREITIHDRELGNVMLRAGFLFGMAQKASPEDRVWLLRASRSLRAYAESLEP